MCDTHAYPGKYLMSVLAVPLPMFLFGRFKNICMNIGRRIFSTAAKVMQGTKNKNDFLRLTWKMPSRGGIPWRRDLLYIRRSVLHEEICLAWGDLFCMERSVLHENIFHRWEDLPCMRKSFIHEICLAWGDVILHWDSLDNWRSALQEEIFHIWGDLPCMKRSTLHEKFFLLSAFHVKTCLAGGDLPCMWRPALHVETYLCWMRPALHVETCLTCGDLPCRRRSSLYEEICLAWGDLPCMTRSCIHEGICLTSRDMRHRYLSRRNIRSDS